MYKNVTWRNTHNGDRDLTLRVDASDLGLNCSNSLDPNQARQNCL